jgi:steroid delta-isomerase-like uncharacterized protein
MKMSIEEKISIAESALEAFNSHDLDKMLSFYSESPIHHMPNRSKPLVGKEAIRQDNVSFIKSFPDVRFEKVLSFGQGDWICFEGIVKGTNKGPFPGPDGSPMPATNKSIEVPVVMISKIENGKIAEVHEFTSQLVFLTQLGLMQ